MFDKAASICFEYNNGTKLFDSNVVYDLRLNKLLSEGSLSVLSGKASLSDIKERRVFFKEITENNDIKKQFENISFISDKIKYLDKKISETKESDFRFYVFAVFYYNIIELIKSISAIQSNCKYVRNTSNFFKEYLNLKEDDIKNAEELYESVKINNSFSLSYKQSGFLFSQNKNDNAYDKTISGLEKFLNIDRPSHKNEFDPGIIIAKAVLKADYYNKLISFYEKYKNTDFSDIFSLTDEISLYSEIAKLVSENSKRGISVSYPDISAVREIKLNNLYDISLSADSVIPNDCSFTSGSGFYLVRGANGGGKTTFLRAVVINLLLLASGCPVFCDSGSSYVPDRIFTHFPVPESFESGGRFQNEVERAEYIENCISSDSFVAFNESFSGTNEEKGVEFTTQTINKIKDKNCFGIFVTHHDISADDIKTLTPVLDGDNRTYKISDNESASESHVNDILKKYGIDKDSLESDIASSEED